MITLTKILQYELRPQSGDIFEYLTAITKQTIDPPSLKPHTLQPTAPVVLHSPLRRATECLLKLPTTTYIELPELREIPFDLALLCTKSEWEAHGSVIVRKRFKQFFMDDALIVKRAVLFSEIESLIEYCRRYSDIQVVSHSFRLKLIEAYLKTNSEIVSHPDLINDFILDDHKTFEFGEGFTIEQI